MYNIDCRLVVVAIRCGGPCYTLLLGKLQTPHFLPARFVLAKKRDKWTNCEFSGAPGAPRILCS